MLSFLFSNQLRNLKRLNLELNLTVPVSAQKMNWNPILCKKVPNFHTFLISPKARCPLREFLCCARFYLRVTRSRENEAIGELVTFNDYGLPNIQFDRLRTIRKIYLDHHRLQKFHHNFEGFVGNFRAASESSRTSSAQPQQRVT